MPLEDAQYISELNPANPPNPDPAAEGAAQIRETKQATFQSFPNIDKEVTASADDLNTLTGVAGTGVLLPTGAVLSYAADNLPNGFLACDGLPIPVEYVTLIGLIGPNTPDLRGQFLRGISDAVGQDPDAPRAALSGQAEAFKAHSHTLDAATDFQGVGSRGGRTASANQGFINPISTEGGDETRPKNIAVQFIIKW
jgi:hypothetical protein